MNKKNSLNCQRELKVWLVATKRGGKNLKYTKPIDFLYLILLKYRIANQLDQAFGIEIKRLSGQKPLHHLSLIGHSKQMQRCVAGSTHAPVDR
jgi:hypothetical protein